MLVWFSGELRTGEINEKTHKPTTLTDLCVIGGLTDRFCVSCEVRIYGIEFLEFLLS